MIKSIPAVIYALILTMGVSAQAKTFTLSGSVHYSGSGRLVIALSTESEFKSNSVSALRLVIDVKDAKDGKAEFAFKGVPKGTYALRCFQDRNGNDVLDQGLFGPVEPVVVYALRSKPLFGPPSFSDCSFAVESDIGNISLMLR